MPYYRVCSFCGAHLDPDEKCDCQRAGGELSGNRDYAGGTEERKYRNSGEGSRNPVEGDAGAEMQS